MAVPQTETGTEKAAPKSSLGPPAHAFSSLGCAFLKMQPLALSLFALAFFLCASLPQGVAQGVAQGTTQGVAQTARTPSPTANDEALLVDAPSPARPAATEGVEPAPDTQRGSPAPLAPTPQKTNKFAQIIEPSPPGGAGPWPEPLSAREKLVFTLRIAARPVNWTIPPLYDASFEQLLGTNPKYGKGAGAFAVQFGSAQLRSVSTRFLGDGIYAALFHQDPRYWRIKYGSVAHRALGSAEQALVRRGDDGSREFNYSGILGRATSAVLVLSYYPPPSRNARVVFETFGTSIATDGGLNLVMEFLPDLARRFPFVKKFLPE